MSESYHASGNATKWSFLVSSYFLGIDGNFWNSLAYKCNTAISATIFTWWYSLWVFLCLPVLSSSHNTGNVGFRAYSNVLSAYLNLILSAKTLIPKKVTGYKWPWISEGHYSARYSLPLPSPPTIYIFLMYKIDTAHPNICQGLIPFSH